MARELGEVMFRKYGVSGIAAFNLSRLAAVGDALAVDFLPALPADRTEAFLRDRRKALRAALGREVTWDDMLRGVVLAPVADVLLAAVGLKGKTPAAAAEAAPVAAVLKGLTLPVEGLGDVRQCQVHRGGVAVEAVDAASCEVRGVPGLYVVGEALDVDAPCGGYNLHWAWASGLLAGKSAVEGLAPSSGSERGEGAPCSDSPCLVRQSAGLSQSLRNCARTPSPRSEPAGSRKRGRR